MPTSNDQPLTSMDQRPLAVTAFGMTDKGRVRPTNEDQFLCAELTKAMRVWQTTLSEPKAQFGEERGHLFLVADGMGGHRAGEQASALAVVAIEQFTLNTFQWFLHSNGAGRAARPRAVPGGAPAGRRAHRRGIGGPSRAEGHGHHGDHGVPARCAPLCGARRGQPGVPVRRRRADADYAGSYAHRGHGSAGRSST